MNGRTLEPLLHSLQAEGRTDADLLERFRQQREEAAFAALIDRHGPMVLAVCRRLLADRHEAEDAFQATFLVLVRKSAELRQPGRLAPWLHRVAVRIAQRLRQRAQRRRAVPESLDPPAPQGQGPAERAAVQELCGIVDEEIERLPSKYRLPVVLCYLQGQSYTEAARSLGWPAGTVSVRLARARQKLRDRFVSRGVGLSVGLAGSVLGPPVLATVPAALSRATLQVGVCSSGVVSQQVFSLAEGALRTMWMAKAKATLCLVLLVGLIATGLGGLAWHQAERVQAQPPRGAFPPPPTGQNRDQDAEEVEKQLKDLQDQIQAKQRQLAQLRQGDALLQIETALKKLKQANLGNAQRSAALAEFEQAFGRLKQGLGVQLKTERLTLRDSLWEGMFVDGRVLQVDAEKKQVLLSTGGNDGIKKGQLYRVYQSGRASPDQTGWIRITQVEARWSVATVLQDYAPRAPLKPNDIIQKDDGKEPKELKEGSTAP